MSLDVLQRIYQVVMLKRTSPSVVVTGASAILDRAVGRPVQATLIAGANATRSMTWDDFILALSTGMQPPPSAEPGVPSEGEVIDVAGGGVGEAETVIQEDESGDEDGDPEK